MPVYKKYFPYALGTSDKFKAKVDHSSQLHGAVNCTVNLLSPVWNQKFVGYPHWTAPLVEAFNASLFFCMFILLPCNPSPSSTLPAPLNLDRYSCKRTDILKNVAVTRILKIICTRRCIHACSIAPYMHTCMHSLLSTE